MTLEKEKQLVELAKNDRQAFAQLYDFYYDRIFNYILRRCGDLYIAEDVTAETFVNVLKNIVNFKFEKDFGFAAWLYKICTNALNMYFRKQNRYKFVAPDDFDGYCNQIIPSEELEEAELAFVNASEYQKINRILILMDQKYQTIIQLRFFEEKSYEEIAYITGIKIGTLKSHLSRALNIIRKNLMQLNNN